LLTAVAAFAEAFVNPVAPLLALTAALFVPRPWLVRGLAALVGSVLAVLAHLDEPATVMPMAMLGGSLALLLHAEIALHLILPVLRWLRHCVVTAWELLWLARAVLGRLWLRARPGGSLPPEKDGAP
jgi:hypothetical protein